MSDYYKDEILHIVEEWPIEQLEIYIVHLEQRVIDTRDQISVLRAVRKRKLRNKNQKDTGARGGKG